jgi:transcriptional regulator with PAS, ATPase and Fis domain
MSIPTQPQVGVAPVTVPVRQEPAILRPAAEPLEEAHLYVEAEEADSAESLSLEDKELEMIRKALNKNKGRRKKAASDLGISERTLYRKIKQYGLE